MNLLVSLAAVAAVLAPAQYPPKDVDIRPLPKEAYTIASPRGIDEQQFVSIGGIDQWVTIRGQDRTNPVLLVLGSPDGGPGSVVSHKLQIFVPWEKDFTVVLWDPRGAGKTYAKAGRKVGPELSLEQIIKDGLELTDYVSRRLGKPKITLLGAAYGSTIGLNMIKARPDKFTALVTAGLMVNTSAEREQYFHRRLVEIATERNDQAALKDLAFSGWDVWADRSDPKKLEALVRVYRKYRPPIANYKFETPNWSLADMAAIRAGAIMADERLLPAWKIYDVTSLGTEFAVPLIVLQGEEDRFAPTPYAKAWLDRAKAPKKVFATVPGAGNHVMETHPAEFLALLRQHVLPVVKGA